MSLGTTGYSLYVGSLWAFQVHGTRAFLIAAGGILGCTAALLWAAQGAIMMSYPLEKDKGRSFSLFWVIFQSESSLHIDRSKMTDEASGYACWSCYRSWDPVQLHFARCFHFGLHCEWCT